jgi:hypothetical protein
MFSRLLATSLFITSHRGKWKQSLDAWMSTAVGLEQNDPYGKDAAWVDIKG